MFASFRSRITRGYVLLAVVLIVVIVGSSSALAFLLFSRGMSDAINGAAQRASDTAAHAYSAHLTFQQAAPRIVAAVGRSRVHVVVVDVAGRDIAENEVEARPGAGRAVVVAFGRLIGLARVRVPVRGGAILISADIDRFGGVLLWYWSIMLPVGLLVVVLAWLAGKRITARAIGPLVEVTQSLRAIASGEISPQPLLAGSSDLRELTDAYNDVVYRLATANAQRTQTEAQMRQFIADAGHELRTPLTIVMGYLDALRQGIVSGEQGTQRTYETMLDESRKMRTLIEKLILLARLDRAQPAALNAIELCEVVRRVADALAPLAQGRVQTSVQGEPIFVRANEGEVYEGIKNAIDNALKYAPLSPVRVSIECGDEQACVIVADDGPGMEPQDVAHAFDRFYRGTTRGEAEGSGLGLAIAKMAVERAGGSASLQSTPGQGTRVRLCLLRSGKPPAGS